MSHNNDFQTVRTLIDRNAALYPGKTAIKEFETGKSCTFAEFKERAIKIGSALFALGAKKGDRVGIMSQNSFAYLELILAVPAAGFIFVPVNFRLAGREMAGVLSDSEPCVLFVDDQYVATAREIKAQIPSVREWVHIGPEATRPEGWHGYEELIKGAGQDGWKEAIFDYDLAQLMYTSGTTGAPKGVMQTHLNMYHCGRTCAFNNRVETNDIGFTVCPMYHVTASTSIFGPFYRGATNVIFQKFDPENMFKAAHQEKIVAGMLATPMVRMILEAWPSFKGKYDVSTMNKLWFAGAGIIPSVYKEFIDTFGNILGEHHGTTETTGVTANLSVADIGRELSDDNLRILESCGRDAYDSEVRIVDDNDNPVIPPGEGEMKVRGLGTSAGYWRKEEQTNKAFRNGWFYTEDICHIDEKGYIYIIDRKKDMIITGGENVYPAEIEKVINEHPAVRESSAIGVPHPVWGEAIAAIIVLNEGADLDSAALIQYCKGKIAGYKVPKIVHFIAEMPRNPAGKISKPELRKRYAS